MLNYPRSAIMCFYFNFEFIYIYLYLYRTMFDFEIFVEIILLLSYIEVTEYYSDG